MAAKYRKIDPRIWTDEKFKKLDDHEKVVALYCLTAQANRIGIFKFSPGEAAEDLGTFPQTFAKRFGNVICVMEWRYDPDAKVLYLDAWWRYNPPENGNVLVGNLADAVDLPATPLLLEFYENRAHLSATYRMREGDKWHDVDVSTLFERCLGVRVREIRNVTSNVTSNVTHNVSNTGNVTHNVTHNVIAQEQEQEQEQDIPPIVPQGGDGEQIGKPPATEEGKPPDPSRLEFDEARKLYPGTKRGLETEFANFRKKHKDWRAVLPDLVPAMKLIMADRQAKIDRAEWVPDQWPHFQTWINQRRWEQAENVEV